jgi:predicted metal-dependent HD superfamily phosphohydrolase
MLDLHRTWSLAWKTLGARTAGDDLFTTLLARYDEPHRHYHSRQHLTECLEHFDAVRHLPTHAAEVEVALWFHDAVYDLYSSDNEARSADWARTVYRPRWRTAFTH